jgi:hypothetical protein
MEFFMKKPDSTKKVLSRRSFMKLVAAGGGGLFLLGKMGNTLSAQDLEVFSEPKRAKDVNEPIGFCQCGFTAGCAGSGGGGQCQCGFAGRCAGSGG